MSIFTPFIYFLLRNWKIISLWFLIQFLCIDLEFKYGWMWIKLADYRLCVNTFFFCGSSKNNQTSKMRRMWLAEFHKFDSIRWRFVCYWAKKNEREIILSGRTVWKSERKYSNLIEIPLRKNFHLMLLPSVSSILCLMSLMLQHIQCGIMNENEKNHKPQ